MNNMFLYIVIGICMLAPYLRAEVVVNEVLANEPGGSVTLEWIELYNDADESALLDGYRLQVGIKSIYLDEVGTIDAKGFLVICRRLFTEGGSPGFEKEWGDNSGFWGDTDFEMILPEPVEASFSLTNSAGSVELYDATDQLISQLVWSESGADGYSWERIHSTSDDIHQSADIRGSTPGEINSVTPVARDLDIGVVKVQPKPSGATFILTIFNAGTNTVTEATLHLVDIGFESEGLVPDTLEVIFVEAIPPGELVAMERTLSLSGTYTVVEATLSDDDCLSNNRIEIILPGVEFPPLILTEVLANPTNGFQCEWIEILNRSETNIDLFGCQFGDSVALRQITTEPYDVLPGEYVVLAHDTAEFLDYYPLFDGIVIEPPSWATFNNSTPDIVRLIDQFGFVLDRFSYHRTFDNNYTWSRDEQTILDPEWSSAENRGGTPGEVNDIYFGPTGNRVGIMIEPRVFSPDGDGIDETVIIDVEAPSDQEYEMKIFDVQGRVVFDFERVRDENEWDGRNNSGERLPIGIYIVYLEVIGGESVKETVVIAR
ncbi:MAG: lamin tail domain-containing protein [candidate division Zixibacteria bacterium]|nr:lamin tail domain-containing protein [candidate division Zixibacteria bacterium]